MFQTDFYPLIFRELSICPLDLEWICFRIGNAFVMTAASIYEFSGCKSYEWIVKKFAVNTEKQVRII